MTALQRLRDIVGARGDWGKTGMCQYRIGIDRLECFQSDKRVMVWGTAITEAQAKSYLDQLELGLERAA